MGPAILGRRAASQARLPVVDIRQNTLALRGGPRRQVLQCQPNRVALEDAEAQAALRRAWSELPLVQSLNRAGVAAQPLSDDELVGVLYHTLNPSLGRRQPLLPQDLTLNRLRDLLAPAAFLASRDTFEAGDRKTRTLAVTGYPRYLHLQWLDVFF